MFRKLFFACLLFLACAPLMRAQETYAQMVRRFDYDTQVPLKIKEIGVENRGGVKVHDISYVGPKGGRVPAYLVVPPGKGPFAAILFGHWAMEGSPMRNRTEFLEEAVVLARAGALCLLIDAPFARPGYVAGTDPLGPQDNDDLFQQVLDLRRGVDLLRARPDVDSKRIAFVGHSFDAGAGAILAGVEKRIKAYVLMAGALAIEEYILSDRPQIVEFRKKVGGEKIRKYLDTYRWADPVHYIGHAAPAALLLQYGRKDEPIPIAMAQRYFDLCSAPKAVKFYDAGHALDAQARRDRVEWLRNLLRIGPVDATALKKVPDVK